MSCRTVCKKREKERSIFEDCITVRSEHGGPTLSVHLRQRPRVPVANYIAVTDITWNAQLALEQIRTAISLRNRGLGIWGRRRSNQPRQALTRNLHDSYRLFAVVFHLPEFNTLRPSLPMAL